MVMRAVRAGRAEHDLMEEIVQAFDTTRAEAARIAHDQCNKAAMGISARRMLSAGITRAIWMHSGRLRHPRHSHVAMDGEEFDLAEGLYDPALGRKVMPGELINCDCKMRPLVPGFARDKAERRMADLAREQRGAA
jgi:uncharacterized protein with gpF-like domain